MENQEVKRLVNITGLCTYTGLGKNKAMEFAKSSGAVIKIGRRCLYDLQTIDKAINTKLAKAAE